MENNKTHIVIEAKNQNDSTFFRSIPIDSAYTTKGYAFNKLNVLTFFNVKTNKDLVSIRKRLVDLLPSLFDENDSQVIKNAINFLSDEFLFANINSPTQYTRNNEIKSFIFEDSKLDILSFDNRIENNFLDRLVKFVDFGSGVSKGFDNSTFSKISLEVLEKPTKDELIIGTDIVELKDTKLTIDVFNQPNPGFYRTNELFHYGNNLVQNWRNPLTKEEQLVIVPNIANKINIIDN